MHRAAQAGYANLDVNLDEAAEPPTPSNDSQYDESSFDPDHSGDEQSSNYPQRNVPEWQTPGPDAAPPRPDLCAGVAAATQTIMAPR